MSLRPLLGAKVDDLRQLRYPYFASIKLDGIRALKYGPELMSRTLKTIPNRAVREALIDVPSGWDGELILGEPNDPDVYRNTNSRVMSRDLSGAGVRFFVFDNFEARGDFSQRLATIHDLPPVVIKLDQILVSSSEEAVEFEERALRQGYEGIVLRRPDGRYKYGRSTLREGFLLKVKRFTDAEATVVGFEEQMHNANPADLDERGYTKRSSHAEGKVPAGVLGALVVNWKGHELRVGTGFDASERAEIWRNQNQFLGKIAKFKYLPIGMKDLPRHPVFIGWRDEIDL